MRILNECHRSTFPYDDFTQGAITEKVSASLIKWSTIE